MAGRLSARSIPTKETIWHDLSHVGRNKLSRIGSRNFASCVTVAKAAEKWLDTCRARGLERSTIDAYAQHAKLHIEPFLGRMKLSQISAPGVREFEDRLRLDGRSPAMVRKILTSLGSLLSDAQERGLVSRNVARELGSRRKKGVDRRADRASELRGLRWADIDLKKNELHVRPRADRYNIIGRPKSELGERTIPLPPIVVNAFREWKLVCPKNDLDIVFASSRGRIQRHSNVVKYGLIPAQIARASRNRMERRNIPGCIACGIFMRHGASTGGRMAG
jgi:integrase